MSARRRLDVAVIGCGTAGPAVALFLARAGHQVALYERVREPGPVGAGIILQPTGQAVLGRLGLRDEVVSRGTRLDGLRVETHRGRTLANLRYGTVGPSLFGVGLHRGVLFASLYRAALDSAVELRLGVTVQDLARARPGWSYLVDADGERHGPHQLVIVADGARSLLRDDTDQHLRKSIRPYPWGALWFVADDPPSRFGTELHQVVHGTRNMIGLLPSGFGPDMSRSTPLVSLFWSIRADRVDTWRAAGLDAWKAQVLGYVPHAGPVLDQITRAEDLLFASYHDVEMPRWHTHNVVYIGDAAHAMSPQLGQGCNLALYDAMVLADCIEEHDYLETALACYSATRHAHLGFYQFVTRWLTPFFQSDYVPLGWMRDLLMAAASRIPFTHRQMVLAMCGTKRGFVRPGLAL